MAAVREVILVLHLLTVIAGMCESVLR